MNLSGIKVLVDGYNLSLPNGSGIKTYGLTLIKALKKLESQVDILFSNNSNNKKPILNEILLFDIYNQFDNKILSLGNIKNILQASSGLFYTAKRIELSNFVIREGIYDKYNFIDSVGIINLKNCYKIANNLYKKTQIITKITPPEKFDIWHATYQLPIQIKGAKKITTIHDLVPLKLPYTTLDDKSFFYENTKNSLKNSDLIITISENSKKDILDFFDVEPEKIFVTYQPIAIEPLPYTETKISEFLETAYGLTYQKYVLFVGTIEPKKNIGRLIDAYRKINPDLPLVIVGKKGWLYEQEIAKLELIFGKNYLNRVKILEYVSTNDLKYLYQGAYCFIFPSLYEGFGLPPLEAMTCGCPVITSNVSSLPEICGDAALYVDPYDINSIAKQLERLLGDRSLRDELSIAGIERAKLFSMQIYVDNLYKAYCQVLK